MSVLVSQFPLFAFFVSKFITVSLQSKTDLVAKFKGPILPQWKKTKLYRNLLCSSASLLHSKT